MNPTEIIWLVLLILFLVAEGATAAVTTIWFAAGALAAMLAAIFGLHLWVQIVLFVAVSIGLLIAFRPLLKKYITPKKTATNVDALVGTKGIIVERVDNIAGTGRVKLGSLDWSARSENGECIEVGVVVNVEKIQGVKAFVSPVNVPVK